MKRGVIVAIVATLASISHARAQTPVSDELARRQGKWTAYRR